MHQNIPRSAADSVDALVAGWRWTLADVDSEPLHVFSRISRIAHRLERARRDAFAKVNLQSWEFDVLSALRRVEPPHELSPGELIRENLVTSGTMTNRITRLANRGLVTRRASFDDARAVRVRLTPAGQAMVESAYRSLLARERNLLEGLSKEEQDALARLLRRLLRAFEEGQSSDR